MIELPSEEELATLSEKSLTVYAIRGALRAEKGVRNLLFDSKKFWNPSLKGCSEMFQSKLSCENCSYSTEPFVGVYVPSSDSTEVVLQDQESKKIRVLELRGIAEMLPPHPSEEQLDERIRQLCEANRQQNEKRVDTWVVPDEFEAIECPCCGKQLVRLQLLSII